MTKAIPYGHQHITDADVEAVVEALRSDYLTQGPRIKQFEDAFAQYVGAKYAVAVSNATAGLHIAAKSVDVKPGQKVIVTAMTFAASANCVRFCGADVEFCDIDPRTYLMDLDKLRQMIESKPDGYYAGAVIVDFGGYPHNLEAFANLCHSHGMWLIEDACHAPGAWFTDSKGHRSKCGSCEYADMAVFSFHPVKHIATGEGGMVTTNDEDLYKRLTLYRTHGITREQEMLDHCDGGWYYEMVDLGFNYRLTDLQAALGISQLKRAAEGLERRQVIARRYDEAFAPYKEIKTPFRAPDILHALHLYVIQVPDRKGLYDSLREQGIYAQVHYVPLHTMPYYRANGSADTHLPVAEDYYAHCLSLPMYPSLSAADQDYVIERVIEFIKRQ